MSPPDGFSVRAILRARERIGPRAALALARARAETLPPGEDRLRLLEVALESAFLAGDERALLSMALAWPFEGVERSSLVVLALVAELRARKSFRAALALANAEVERMSSGAAYLALAAAAEEAGHPDSALAALSAARECSDARVQRRALIESLRLGPLDLELTALAVDIVRSEASSLDDRDALFVAAASLHSSSRYDRALALDELVRVARTGHSAARSRALRTGLLHADRVSGALSSLELERLVVLVAAALLPGDTRSLVEQDLDARMSPLGSPERATLLGGDRRRRARAVLAGSGPGSQPPAADPGLGEWLVLRAISAVRAGRDDEAFEAIDAMLAQPEPLCEWWSLVLVAAERPALSARVQSCVDRLAATAAPPSRLLHEIAARLESLGHEECALAAHRVAMAFGEGGAQARLVAALVRAGWRAAEARSVERAIELLGEARKNAGPPTE